VGRIECVNVEIVYSYCGINKVDGAPLAERNPEHAFGIVSRPIRMILEELLPVLPGDSSETLQVAAPYSGE
jgi:hypothetical protein